VSTVRSDNLSELAPALRRIVDGRIALSLAYVTAMLAAEQRKQKPIEEVIP